MHEQRACDASSTGVDPAPTHAEASHDLPSPTEQAVRTEPTHADAAVADRVKLVTGVRLALVRSREARTLDEVLRAGVRAVCADCGFDRVILFAVSEGNLRTRDVFFANRTDWAGEVLDLGRQQPTPLTPRLEEADALRRRRTIIVRDAEANENTPRRLVAATRTSSYVAAPIVVGGHVIGFFHGDHFFGGRPVNEDDRQILWAYAEAFGSVVEAAATREHVQRQRDEIDRLMERIVPEPWNQPIDIDAQRSGPSASRAVDRHPLRDLDSTATGLSDALTRREFEVLRLVATGRMNATIADELVVTVNTVKTHVKHIMRKLGVTNRAEAAAWYHSQCAKQEREASR